MKIDELKDFVKKIEEKEKDKSAVWMDMVEKDGQAQLKLAFMGHLTVSMDLSDAEKMQKKDVLSMIYNNLGNLVKGIMDNIGKIDDLHQRLQKVVDNDTK